MADNHSDDDFGVRTPGYRDYDAEMNNVVRVDAETPPEVKDRHLEEALDRFPHLREGIGKDILLDDKRGIICIDDEKLARGVETAAKEAADAAAQAAAKEADKATTDALGQVTNPAGAPASDSASGGAPGAGSADGAKAGADKPTNLESMLANIRLNGDRQRRLVISGDPQIERAFYEKLAASKKLYYSGGVPMITISRDKAIKLLQETAREFDGAAGTHALSLKLDREAIGLRESISAGFKNLIGRQHQIDVIVVGKQEVLTEKLKELGQLATTLEKNGHIRAGSALVENGALKLAVGKKGENQPVELDGTTQLYNVLQSVKNKVDTYNAEKSTEQAAIKEFKHEQDLAKMKKASGEAGTDASEAAPKEVNPFTEKLATKLNAGFDDPTLLHSKGEGKQVLAVGVVNQVPNIAKSELQSLPDGDRQRAIVQLAALLAKVDDKQYDKHHEKNEQPLSQKVDAREFADTASFRDKVASFISMEAASDPQFKAKAEPLLKDMVERKVLTEQQAESISGRIAEAVTAAHGASTKEAPSADAPKAAEPSKDGAAAQAPTQATAPETAAPARSAESGQAEAAGKDPVKAPESTPVGTEQATGKAPVEAQAGDAPAASKVAEPAQASAEPSTSKVAEAAPAGDAPRAAGESRDAGASVAEGKAQSADHTAALAAKPGTEADAVKAPAADAAGAPKSGAESHSTGSTTAAIQSAGEATTQPVDKPLDLRDRIEAMAKDGPAKLTEDKAHSLVAELDAIRTKPLSSLDANSGDKPTQTLVRAEALLKELETGRLGPELKAQAKDLSDSLQKWGQQDAARYEKDASLATAQRTEVVAQVKSAEPAWQGQSPTPRQEAAAPAQPAPAEAPKAPAVDAQAAAKEVAQAAPRAPTEGTPAADAAREQAAQRLAQTETAGAKLSMLMANPAGSFTNRDKTWNETNIQRAASEVLRIDPDAVSQLSAQQRTKVAMYAVWVADSASNGKLPGFSSEEGKAQANQLVERAAALIGKMEEGSKPSPDVLKSVEKAERMVGAMEQLQKSSSMSSQASREDATRGGISPDAAGALAKDLVHSVYRQAEMSDAQAKYLLKNAANLTPEATKSLDPQTRAQAAVAMGHLAQQVRDGAMGDFSKLPPSVQKNVTAAGNTAENLLTSMGKDPSMRAELNQAYSELHAKNSGATASAPKAASAEHSKDAANSAPAADKQGGRSLDR